MSNDAIASWLRVKQLTSVARKIQNTRIRPSVDEPSKPNKGNATLASLKSAQSLHHRIFWREETTTASLWEGTHRGIEGATTVTTATIEDNTNKPPSTHKVDEPQQQAPSSSASGQKDAKRGKRLSPANTIREISSTSDLQRLARLLNQRRINTSCRETFAAALRDGNPAVIDMWLRHGKEHKGVHFLEAFRAWGEGSVVTGRPPPSFLLHLSCHAGSPEVVSVLLQFMAESYSSEDLEAMVNARDPNGRTALHLSSWSPTVQCPGKRNTIVSKLLAHGADVRAKDKNGRTALHQACRAADCFAVEILLNGGADPLQEDDRQLTPLETATMRKHRHLLDVAFRRHLSTRRYLRLCARITAKSTINRIMRRFIPMCDTCSVRPAETCNSLKRNDFPAWVYKHQRWPKAGDGKWREVRPSCVEKKASRVKAKT